MAERHRRHIKNGIDDPITRDMATAAKSCSRPYPSRSAEYQLFGRKTQNSLALAAHVALGRPLGERDIEKRPRAHVRRRECRRCLRVVDCAGATYGLRCRDNRLHFVPGRFKIAELIEKIRTEMEALGGCALLIIDTTAAYFHGEDENDNVQLGQHASDMGELRIPGGPCTTQAFPAPIRFMTARLPLQSSLVGKSSPAVPMDHQSAATATRHF
jgi:AAA domain